MTLKKINSEHVGRISAFSHAVIAGDFIYISGIIGTKTDKMELVQGGIEAETAQILFHFETILNDCNAKLKDIVKVTVYLKDLDTFHDMNSAYLDVINFKPPARATVQVSGLLLGAAVEMDCIAYRPQNT